MPPHDGFTPMSRDQRLYVVRQCVENGWIEDVDADRLAPGWRHLTAECIGGPCDGESRRIDSTQCDRGGCYVPLSDSLAPGKYRVRELRWVPDQ